jgi:hypothetical protein
MWRWPQGGLRYGRGLIGVSSPGRRERTASGANMPTIATSQSTESRTGCSVGTVAVPPSTSSVRTRTASMNVVIG